MSKPKVYVHRLGEWYKLYMNEENEALLASFADVVSEGDRTEPMTEEELIERMQGARAILSLNGMGCNEITVNVLRSIPSLELICISHWWEQLEDKAREAGIRFIEGSNSNTVAVAEWVLACALMGVRKIMRFNDQLKSGSQWCEPHPAAGMLCEKSVGIVAYGRVGHYTAHCFKMMGCKVYVCDKMLTKEQAEKDGVELADMDWIFANCDVISLHLPVLPSTRGIIGADQFRLIKDGAVFINSSRAAVYDEEALICELKKNRFDAYLDVFAVEPLEPDHPFRSMDNVTITPHIAGNNPEMFRRCGREAVLTLKNYFEGNEAVNRKYALDWLEY